MVVLWPTNPVLGRLLLGCPLFGLFFSLEIALRLFAGRTLVVVLAFGLQSRFL